MRDRDEPTLVFKVVYVKDKIETVYHVVAFSERDARRRVLDDRHPGREAANLRDTAWAKRWSCSFSVTPYRPDPPVRLYAFNTLTGEMS